MDINGLVEDPGNGSMAAQDRIMLAEITADLKQSTAALNAAIARAESAISDLGNLLEEMRTKGIKAAVHPETLKALNEISMNFVIEEGTQLMAHKDKQIELHEKYMKRIAEMFKQNEGIWLSNHWLRFLIIVQVIFAIAVFLWAYCK